jgi:CelD/BcsL family acetyltransferase involved in cellulose biosynthesis
VACQTPSEAARQGVTVECVDTEREFARLESEWNRLLMKSERPVPFLTWEWVSTWWQHFRGGSRLFVLVARDRAGGIQGIAPLRVVTRRAVGVMPVRSVEFLGYRGSKVCADHMDFMTHPTNRLAVTGRLIDEIYSRTDEWDMLLLADLAEESAIPPLLEQRDHDSDFSSRLANQEHCPYVELPSRWELLLGSLKTNYRNNVKRRREKLSRDFRVDFDWNSSADCVHSHIKVLSALHSSARNRRGEAGSFQLKEYREFHFDVAERMARAGYLYLARLDGNHTPIAALYGFHLGGRLFGYQTGFDSAWASKGVGAVLQAKVFEDAIERLHATEYDFLRGTEEYKYTWTNRVRVTRTVLGWGHSLSARLSRAEFEGRRRLSPIGVGGRRWARRLGAKMPSFRIAAPARENSKPSRNSDPATD